MCISLRNPWNLGMSLNITDKHKQAITYVERQVANYFAVCYSTDVFYQANKYC